MIRRGLLLADGRSDEPLGAHIAAMFAEHGCTVRIAAPDLGRLRRPPGLRVEDRLRAALELDDEGSNFDVIVVHRDAEGQDPALRHQEIATAMSSLSCTQPFVPVVPIRMTEAWLLLDETAIREVAGRPSGRRPLGLPKPSEVERTANPKAVLKGALVQASGCSGRRLQQFERRFPDHRRALLERLDPHGPVTGLTAWRQLLASVRSAAGALGS